MPPTQSASCSLNQSEEVQLAELITVSPYISFSMEVPGGFYRA